MKRQNPRGPVAALDPPSRAVEDGGDVVALDLLKSFVRRRRILGVQHLRDRNVQHGPAAVDDAHLGPSGDRRGGRCLPHLKL